MKLLVVGSGGREHAILWALEKTSQRSIELYCAPGNAGTEQIAQNLPIEATDTAGLARFAFEEQIDLTFVGPEGPLAAGIVDEFKAAGLKTVEGLAVEGSVQWFATELDTVTFDGRRDSNDDVGAVSGLPYVTSQYGARIDHELLRNVILAAGVDAGSREYDTIDRTDDFQRVHLEGDYVLNRRVSLNATYDFSKVNSSGAQAYRDYNVNTFMVSLGLHL